MVALSFIIYLIYIVVSVCVFGIPESVSDTYYQWKEKNPKLSVLFPLFCMLAGMSLMTSWIVLSEGRPYQFLSFLAPAALVFVGIACGFKESLTKTVHYGSAVVCFVCAILWLLLERYWFSTSVVFFPCLCIAFFNRKNWLFWVETAAFLSVYINLARI